jgi:catechol 2,3-dioxygenase-like lactoylglutathione lyase family enzyme
MHYESATLRTAFCILPQKADETLSFYTDVLGLKVIRYDESFRRFNTQPTIVCLWEIGHVSRHLGFANHAARAVAAKAIVFLEVPTPEAADAIQAGCHARGLIPMAPLLAPLATNGFTVRDSNDCFWTITVSPGAGPAQVPRFGVLAEDFDASVAFYRDVMRLRPVSAGPDNARFATSDIVEIEIVRRSSVPGVEPLTEEQRRAHLHDAGTRLQHTGRGRWRRHAVARGGRQNLPRTRSSMSGTSTSATSSIRMPTSGKFSRRRRTGK